MAKRPQKRTAELTAPQLEQPQFQVQARPVDTALKPSTAGAPAAPQLKPNVAKPDLEPAREMARMGQALGALSGTIRDVAKLEAIRTDEFYKEANDLATETDLSIAELMEQGKLKGTSPAHMRGYSRAAATNQLLELAKLYDASESTIRSSEDALDPDYANRFIQSQADKIRQSIKKSGLDYGHFNKAFNRGLGSLLEKVNARHSSWAGEEHQNRAASNLSAELEIAYRTMWDSDDPLKQAKFRQQVAELIEGRADGVLTRRATHQLVGQAAVDLIINMPEAEAAMNSVLDDVPIGPGVPDDFFTPRSGMDRLPVDTRKGRLGKIAEVRNYRTDKGPQIATAVGGRARATRKAALASAAKQVETSISGFAMNAALVDDGASFSAETVIQDEGGLTQFVEARLDELGISKDEYTILPKDDDSVLLVDKETGEEKTIPVRSELNNAQTNLWRNLAGPGMDPERQVRAALSTGNFIPKSVTAENKRRIESGLNAAFLSFASEEAFDPSTLKELIEVHRVWESMNSVGLGMQYVGDLGNDMLMRVISHSRRLVGTYYKTEQDAIESLAYTQYIRQREGSAGLSVAASEIEQQLGTLDEYKGAVSEIKFLTKTLMLMDDMLRNNPAEALTEARAIYDEQYDSPVGDLSSPIFKPLLYGDNPREYGEIKQSISVGTRKMAYAISTLDPLVFTEEDILNNKTVNMDDLSVAHIHVQPNPRDPRNPTYRFRLEGGGHFEFAVNRINGEGDETTITISHNEMLQMLARRPARLKEIQAAAEARKASIKSTQEAIRSAAVDEFLTRLLPLTGPGFEAELEGYDISEVYEGKPKQSRIRSGNPLAELILSFGRKPGGTERLFEAMTPRQRRMMYHPDLLLAARQLPQELKAELPEFSWMWNKNSEMPNLLERRGGTLSKIFPIFAETEESRRPFRFETDINQNMLYGKTVEGAPYKRTEREQLIYDMLSESPRFIQTLAQGGITRTQYGEFEYVNPVQGYKRGLVEGRTTRPDVLFDLHVAYYYNTQLSPEEKELLGSNFKFLEYDYPYSFYEVEDSYNRVVDPKSSLRDSE